MNFSTRSSEYGRYIRKERDKYLVFNTINGKFKRFGLFNFYEEANIQREKLISDNWGQGKESILFNLGIKELGSHEEYIGKIGRKFTVFKWEGSKCTLFGYYRSHRLALKARDKLIYDKSINFEDINFNEKDTRYIVPVRNSYRISKAINGKIKYFGHYRTLEKAIEVRDELIKNNWDDSFLNIKSHSIARTNYYKNIHRTRRGYDIVKRVDGKLINFGSFENLNEAIAFKTELENNNWEIPIEEDGISEEKYDEYIYLKPDGKFYLKNEIEGAMRIFGIFDNPLDAIEARLDCMKNNWDTSSILENEYNSEEKHNISFGIYNEELEDIDESDIYSNIVDNCLDFPVTVGKSYKNGGWAIKKSYLGDFIPPLSYEKECIVLIEGVEVIGKLNIHTRMFYYTNDELSDYLEKLYKIDPKIQTRINLDLSYGKYNINKIHNEDFLSFETKFSKSFKNGMFVMPRRVSKEILPILPYEDNANFSINGIPAEGRFNLEFRIIFNDENVVSNLESKKEDNDELNVILLL